jgi:hypothetical protein
LPCEDQEKKEVSERNSVATQGDAADDDNST